MKKTLALCISLLSFSATAIDVNEYGITLNHSNSIPMFVSGESVELEKNGNDLQKFSASSSSNTWPIQSRQSYQVCVRYEGEQPRSVEIIDFSNTQVPIPTKASTLTKAPISIKAINRRCVEWQTRYNYTDLGTAHIYKGADNFLDKPVVIVQPYQIVAGESNYSASQFYSDINQSGLATSMRSAGYDVILYRYADMDSGIANNAKGLKILLSKLNTTAGVSSTSVIGLSMGGVVARYSLTEMQHYGIPNNVSTYISFDAPHAGANMPKAVIDNMKRLQSKIDTTLCGLSSDCREARRVMDAIIAKLYTQTYKELIIDAPSGPDARNALQSKLASMGNFPSIPSLALTNGAKSLTQGFPTSRLVTHFKLHRKWYNGGSKYFKVYTAPSKDNVAGGYADIYKMFSDIMASQSHPITNYVNLGQKHSFVSTNSALAGSPSYTPFTTVASYPSNNERHMTLTSAKATAIRSWLDTYQN